MDSWNKYPYTDFHEMNLDFILKTISDLQKDMVDFTEYNEIKFHDPIEWNISTQYTRNTVVSSNGIAYLSKQPVPSGIAISNNEYWLQIGNFDTSTDYIKEGITLYNEGVAARASRNYSINDLIWWKNGLYVAVVEIIENDPLTTSNLNATTISEQLISIKSSIDSLTNDINNEIVDRQNAIEAESIARDEAIASIKMNDLKNVNAPNPSNGQILKYNSATNTWYNANESGGGGTSVDIDDITITENIYNQIQVANDLVSKINEVDGKINDPLNATDGQVLTFENNAWIAKDSAGGGYAEDIIYDNTESGLESTDVQGALDEITEELSSMSEYDDEDYVSLTTGLKVCRKGNIISLSFYGNSKTITATNNSEVVATLSEKYRPISSAQTGFIVTAGVNTTTPYTVIVGTDGKITVFNRKNVIEYWYGNITWLV